MSTQPSPKTTETPKTAKVAATEVKTNAAQTKTVAATPPAAKRSRPTAKAAATTDQPTTVRLKTAKPLLARARSNRRDPDEAAHSEPARQPTKKQIVIDQLGTPAGVTIASLQKLTGWQPHTIRATLSMLRKAGMAITSSRSDEGPTRYRIIAAPLDKATAVMPADQPSGASACA